MHYSYKEIGDVLLIIFDNSLKATRSEKKGRVTVIYHDEQIIGYNIFDIKEIIKIKNQGMIYFPNPALVEVVNTLLKNAGVPTLDIYKESGYYIGEVTEVNDSIVYVNLGNEQISSIVDNSDVNVGDKLVVAKVDTRLSNGKTVKEKKVNDVLINGHICLNKELGIEDNGEQITILDKEAEIGKDFFYLEAK